MHRRRRRKSRANRRRTISKGAGRSKTPRSRTTRVDTEDSTSEGPDELKVQAQALARNCFGILDAQLRAISDDTSEMATTLRKVLEAERHARQHQVTLRKPPKERLRALQRAEAPRERKVATARETMLAAKAKLRAAPSPMKRGLWSR